MNKAQLIDAIAKETKQPHIRLLMIELALSANC